MLGAGTRFQLYRSTGACSTSSRKYADYLTRNNLFTYSGVVSGQLPTLSVQLPVDTKPTDAIGGYELRDAIVLRNATRGT